MQIRHDVKGNPQERQEQREQRIRLACDAKLGKLASWKRDAGARTILLLENPDMQATDSTSVAEAFLSIAEGRLDRPDETYLIDTSINPTWYLWPLLIDDQSYFDLGRKRHPLPWEMDGTVLVSATKR